MSAHTAASSVVDGKPLPSQPSEADSSAGVRNVHINDHLVQELKVDQRGDIRNGNDSNGAHIQQIHGDELVESDDPEHVR